MPAPRTTAWSPIFGIFDLPRRDACCDAMTAGDVAPSGKPPKRRSRQSQETAGLKGANVPDGLFFQIQAWSAKKAGISYRFGNPTGMNS